MRHEVTVGGNTPLDWNAKGNERILQNVRNLLSTWRYEVAYDRLLGLPPEFVDAPSTQLCSQLQTAATELVERFEPRARIEGIEITCNADGDVIIKAVVSID